MFLRLVNILVYTIAIIVLLIICCLIVTFSRIGPNNRENYYLYDKKLGTFLLSLTLIATQVGGGMIVGLADISYKLGLNALFYPIGSVIGLLVIAFALGKFLKSSDIPTVSAVFEKKYKFSIARKLSSVISSISLFSIMIAQGVAIRHLLNYMGFSDNWVFISIWSTVILYTTVGGIKAVVHTNVLQILLISVSLITLLFATLQSSNIESIDFTFSVDYSIIELFIWPCCYMLIEQDMAQLFFCAKSKKVIEKASIIAAFGIFTLATIPACIGIIAKKHYIPQDTGILLFFAKTYLSKPVYTMVAISIILAITSTIDSLLCAISSNISYDFSIWKSKSRYFSSEMISTLIIGLSSLIIVFYLDNIINILMFSYSFCVSTLFVPSLLGFLLPEKKLLKSSVILSFLFGIASLTILSYIGKNITYLSLFFSVLGYFLPYVKNTSICKLK